MKNNPKLSVICPVYNAEKYLGRLIESLQKQSFEDFELIMIDDGSSDDSLNVLKQYAKKDKRIKVITQKNQGIAKARNLGISIARGKYLMFVDNDDYVLDGYFEKYVTKIERTKADIVIGGYQRRNVDGKIIETKRLIGQDKWNKFRVVAPWAKIYRADFVKREKICFLNYDIGEDVYFNILAYYKTNKIIILNNTDYVWFYNEKSISNSLQKGMKNEINITILLNKISEQIKNEDVFLKYFMRRYIVWFLLYSGKTASSQDFVREFNELKKWQKENKIAKTISPWSRKLAGENFGVRFSVFVMNGVEKFHLEKVFAKLYCKEKK